MDDESPRPISPRRWAKRRLMGRGPSYGLIPRLDKVKDEPGILVIRHSRTRFR